jgi:ATP-dependent helicase HrpA
MDKERGTEPEIGAAVRRVRSLLQQSMLRDRAFAGRKLQALHDKSRRARDPKTALEALDGLEKRLEASIREKEARIAHCPALRYPRELPIVARRQDIVRAIRDHQVVIISGETGCGKSTQIPKMCLEAGRGAVGKVGCTQPRRIAAITIAHRIAQELGEPLGRSVGYKIRFQDRTSRDAYVKIMTDGMLLAETQADPRLYEYDTLIVDEAHERSLNIDFLLGIARTLLDARPDLKLVITSATLDTEKFSKAFGHAPVIHVGGRMFPVEVEYEPDDAAARRAEDTDYVERAVKAVDGLKARRGPGDILVFMPTEQDILETCEKLAGKHYPGTTILPLYARLPAAQQGRVYSVPGAKIVVATNVAETSLTIPGIRFVVDTGLARISQYQPGTRINSLPVSDISRASADQRKGRCGRVQEGTCVRLYTKEDYESRPEFTPPEILRSNLAEVILRMIDLKLGYPSDFPFVDMPHPRAVKDGFDTLLELGAISGKGRDFVLTPLGRRMAPMPLDPRISRMLLKSAEEGCLREVAIIASALSIRDPRERPPDQTAAADARHALFKHPDSDFLSFLGVWEAYRSANKESGSQNKLKKFCAENFLSFPRMREWGFVHDQVLAVLEEQNVPPGRREKLEMSEGLYAAVHRSILSGFLSNIAAHKEKSIYTAARGREVMAFPGSTVFGKARPWIVAADMVQTSRVYARTAAKIDPGWLEELGGSLCRYSYSDPHWDKERGEVAAKEKVTLFGLEIVSGRSVSYARIAPGEAHEIFVRSALVEGEVEDPPPFLKHNLKLTEKVAELEEKLRRRDICVSEDDIARFYSSRVAGAHNFRTLEKEVRERGGDALLRMTEKDLMRVNPDEERISAFPDVVDVDGRPFRAVYKFAPGEDWDGVTLKVPASLVKSLPAEPLEWGVPGQYPDKIAALLKGLPKRYRKLLMPLAEKAEVIVREMQPADVSLFRTLAKFVKQRFQVEIPAAEWAKAEIPLHLRTRVAVTDHEGREIAAARNLDILRKSAVATGVPEDSPAWKSAKERWERTGVPGWDFGPLPETVAAGPYTAAFPGLEAGEKGVGLRLFRSREEAVAAHSAGVAALLLPRFAKDLDFVKRCLALPEECDAAALFFGGKAAVMKAMGEALKREVLRKNVRTKEEFDALSAGAVRNLFAKGTELKDLIVRILGAYGKVRGGLPKGQASKSSFGGLGRASATGGLSGSIRAELDRLVPANFLETLTMDGLRQLPRRLEALRIRAERAQYDPEKDRKKEDQVEPYVLALGRIIKRFDKDTSPEKKAAVEELRGMIEEFRVSLFAPEVKTAFPISPKRLALKIKEIEAMG